MLPTQGFSIPGLKNHEHGIAEVEFCCDLVSVAAQLFKHSPASPKPHHQGALSPSTSEAIRRACSLWVVMNAESFFRVVCNT